MGANRQVLEWLALVKIAGAFNLGPALVKIAGAFDENGQVLEWLVDADGLFSNGLPTHTQLSEAYRPLRRRRLWPLPLSEVVCQHTLSCQRRTSLYGGGNSCRFRFQKFHWEVPH